MFTYFKNRNLELRMPKAEGKPDACGIRYEGDVLNGRAPLPIGDPSLYRLQPARLDQYGHVIEDDPVLKFHTRR